MWQMLCYITSFYNNLSKRLLSSHCHQWGNSGSTLEPEMAQFHLSSAYIICGSYIYSLVRSFIQYFIFTKLNEDINDKLGLQPGADSQISSLFYVIFHLILFKSSLLIFSPPGQTGPLPSTLSEITRVSRSLIKASSWHVLVCQCHSWNAAQTWN